MCSMCKCALWLLLERAGWMYFQLFIFETNKSSRSESITQQRSVLDFRTEWTWHREMVLSGDRIKPKLFLILEHLLCPVIESGGINVICFEKFIISKAKCPWIVHQPLRIHMYMSSVPAYRIGHRTIFVAVSHVVVVTASAVLGRCHSVLSLLTLYARHTQYPTILRCLFHQIINIFREPMTQYLVCDRFDRDQLTTVKKTLNALSIPIQFLFQYREWKSRRRGACKRKRLNKKN